MLETSRSFSQQSDSRGSRSASGRIPAVRKCRNAVCARRVRALVQKARTVCALRARALAALEPAEPQAATRCSNFPSKLAPRADPPPALSRARDFSQARLGCHFRPARGRMNAAIPAARADCLSRPAIRKALALPAMPSAAAGAGDDRRPGHAGAEFSYDRYGRLLIGSARSAPPDASVAPMLRPWSRLRATLTD
jgi:hypothetical protein